MLSIEQAQKKLLFERAEIASVEGVIRYRDVYLFRVRFTDGDEAQYDPFFSVNVIGGEVKDFSVFRDGDLREITYLFLAVEDDD